jgi:hypothetical protein
VNYRISICIMLCLAILASGQAVAQPAPQPVPLATFGTKVIAGDADVGQPLSQFLTPPQLGAWVFYWDVGSTSGMYDDKDVAYLRFGSALPAQVQANNIRLTGWGNYPAGSYVKPGDSDIGQALIMPPTPALPSAGSTGFYYMDLTGGPGYDMGDPVYLKVQLPNALTTGTNDIRITASAGFSAGSRVSLIDPDANKPLSPFKAIATAAGGPFLASTRLPVAELAFFNANGNTDGAGNPIYDEGDVVYFDISPGGPFTPIVSPNDIRLY